MGLKLAMHLRLGSPLLNNQTISLFLCFEQSFKDEFFHFIFIFLRVKSPLLINFHFRLSCLFGSTVFYSYRLLLPE